MSDDPDLEFGTLLRQLRLSAGLTQEELADKARISADAIAALERGRRKAPRARTLRLLAVALELSAAQRATLTDLASAGHAVGKARHSPPDPLVELDRETQYAWSGEISIAFQVCGEGPIDIVLVPGWVSHLEVAWEHPGYRRFMDRLSSIARVIVYDKRGTGLSDPVETAPPFDPRLDDLSAVIEAARCQRPVVFGVSEGSTIAALFAATHPDHVRQLILYGGYPRTLWAEDYPFGVDPAMLDEFIEAVRAAWGEGVSLNVLAPYRIDDDEFRRWWSRFERMSASPGLAASVLKLNSRLDIREALPAIRVPTLLVHRVGDVVPIEGARYMAQRIPDAQLVELPGGDHWPWLEGGVDVLGPIEEFVTGRSPTPQPDRILSTVMFSDIVGATARAAEITEDRWPAVLARLHTVAREAIEAERGVVIKPIGDAMMARFDRPTAAVHAAGAIASTLAERVGLQARLGLHTGEVELLGDDIAGMAVDVAARICSLAKPGQVLVSRTVKDLVYGADFNLHSAGTHVLEGISEHWQLFALADQR